MTETSERRLRIGLVGCGVIAQVMHLPFLAELSDRFVIAAVCDVSADLAAACAARYQVAHSATDWRKLLDLPLDAIMVLTPGSHAPIAIAAAEAGKHVFIEKPLAFSVAEAEAVLATAARTGVTMMLGYNKRYDPAFEALQASLAETQDVRLVRVTTFESPFEPYIAHLPMLRGQPLAPELLARLRQDNAERLEQAVGGDAEGQRLYHAILLDSMVHELNALRALLGPPDRVDYADLGRHGATIILRFGETRAVLTWIDLPGIARYGMEFAFFAPDRRLTLSFPSPYLRNAAAELTEETGIAGSVQSQATQRILSHEASFKAELVHFHDCVTQGAKARTPVTEGLQDISLCAAILESHRSRRPVILSDDAGDRT
ncbi:Gfo/Idh/MocA family oxidoreductase [Acidisoma cellulosilytica]|uniref:Gfo/Idh/MocA family oxidoreductase n=1 Tax=Acidisoma cellulosilyticum TaxID=2802395 RepID=A0A964E6L6_9PROT|nr:Gfo/Idh/MocA family oxidoreductase [Acidisoma cellulosilyticum]MCB8883592.1 Gfo/Idh/MocA family oxidoreductase [Acidisoma cellulosilyticum]